MKRLFTLLSLFVGVAAGLFAQEDIPQFSTAEKPVYYRVQFKNSRAVLEDKGLNQQIKTAAISKKDAQLFALIGTRDNFKMKCKNGNYLLSGSGNAGHLLATKQENQATAFALKDGGIEEYFHVMRTSDPTKSFNQWGGAGTNKPIGFWDINDPGNLVTFLDPNEVTEYRVHGANSFSPESKHTLWYDRPATLTTVADTWMEYSLPIGNGVFGASLFGGIKTDEIQFNDKSLWEGKPSDMQGQGSGYGKYMNFGSVLVKNLADENFSLDETKAVKNYVRYLDIERAIAGVNFTGADGTKYTRQYLASQVDGVVAVRYKAEGQSKLSFQISYRPGDQLNNNAPTYSAEGYGTFTGKLTTVYYDTRFKIVAPGATISATKKGVEVKNAEEVYLILGGATSFDSSVPSRTSGNATDLMNKVKGIVDKAANKVWDTMVADHVKEFQSYMGRVSLNLNDAHSARNTEALVKYYNASPSNKKTPEGLFLEQLYFYYGRYLSISSSRGSMRAPNNLQGIWNDKADAPWKSDIHTNINIQMNYWPTEPTNLSECHVPLLDYIIDNAKSDNWRRAAKKYGGQDKGWTVFTESTIFGGMSLFAKNYFVANAWYCSHLWQHYRYTLDKEYLKEAFPAMWSSAEFWMGRMKKDKDGKWVCPNEWSPEHGPNSEDATAHAQQLVTENLQMCVDAVEALGGATAAGISQTEYETLKSYLANIDRGLHIETYDGQWGNTFNTVKRGEKLLREWKKSSYTSGQKHHRHMSHLMCLYPFSQVVPGEATYEAAVNSLRHRGDEATGWSMGWKVNLWARAKDGDHAHTIIRNALRYSGTGGGGIYYNLYDAHPPFQIDGNFGVCAGMAEMLMQSHLGVIEILPALPRDWKKGSIKGLKAVGNFTVDLAWQNGKATMVSITSHKGAPLIVKSEQDLTKVLVTNAGQEVKVTAVEGKPGQYNIPAAANATIEINFAKTPSSIQASQMEQGQLQIYDLSGRRASTHTHGIHVVNGQKVAL